MEIITAHEADQLIATRRPLTWPIHTTCNSNCQQGRACDCTAVADADADEWEPLSLRDHLAFWVPVVSFTAGLLLTLLYAMGWRV